MTNSILCVYRLGKLCSTTCMICSLSKNRSKLAIIVILVSYCIILLSLSDTHTLCPQSKILNKRASLVPSIIIRSAASRSKTKHIILCINTRGVIKLQLSIKLTAMYLYK